ncbi:MAG: type II toxin-antitoxin system RelE/ParE family toxin [Rhodospirillales bacterium]|nr:MAG: type II toxin-antitoxin system RelE/ParE family toxin [Rhodospirillales bacterium]
MDEIVWTQRARHNLEDIGEYIAQDDPHAAERTIRRIVEQVSGLAFYPQIGRVGSVEDTRELVVSDTPYIVVYRIRERVEILRVRHAAQRWPDFL